MFAHNPRKLKFDKSIIETDVISDFNSLRLFLQPLERQSLPEDVRREICSVIEGAKGLIVPRPRDVSGISATSKAAQVNALEAEIHSFDRDQKHGYMEVFEGPQRIRGLAGSGKTVVLAMKAALTHLKDPDASIVFTFYTRSLYQHVRRLITRFYRQYNDQDPDWDKLLIMHAWGGRTRAGVYYNACLENGITPLTYSDVSQSPNPFDAVCKDLLKRTEIRPLYDYVFVDEGQDFPSSFLRIALSLAKNRKFVYAYDELQNIFQADIPSTESIFGEHFELDEDVVLKKCYRNPREVLVCAHSLGFGLYGDRIVQMLENREHWQDLGYEVRSGTFEEGKQVDIERLAINSPNSISKHGDISSIVAFTRMKNAREEVDYVAAKIANDIREEGLNPEDIVVVCADDRYARRYFSALQEILSAEQIRTNNLNADTFSGDVFTREKSVTLSSVHRAKGNEGYSVYVMGVDALFLRPTVRTRNLIFTAMTRAKAWLNITGVGTAAQAFEKELNLAKRNFPHLRFTYPSASEIKIMKRDLLETSQERLEKALAAALDEIPEEDIAKVIAKLKRGRGKKFR